MEVIARNTRYTSSTFTDTRSPGGACSVRWADSLRVACATLRRTSPPVVGSITMILPTDGSAREIAATSALVKSLAARHGLVGQVSRNGVHTLKVWFGRAEAESAVGS
jgi:hypothetical protein